MRATLAALFAVLAGVALPLPGLAQETPDRERLDQQPAPSTRASVVIEQVVKTQDHSTASVPQLGQRPVEDRTQQVGPQGERRFLPQTAQAAPAAPRDASGVPALSTRRDGRPQPASVLGGSDRCDSRRTETAKLPLCRHVIERRAGEFAVSVPPRISPEAAIIALDRASGSLAESLRGDRRTRTADGESNPDSQIAQELASITIGSGTVPAAPVTPPASVEPSLIEAISQLLVQVQSNKP